MEQVHFMWLWILLFCASTCSELVTPAGFFNNFTINPFQGTMLNQFINFRFKQRGFRVRFPDNSWEQAMLTHEPLIFQYFDWVIWLFDRGHIQGDLNRMPYSVLFKSSEVAYTAQLLGRIPALREEEQRVLVMAGGDEHLSDVLLAMQQNLDSALSEADGQRQDIEQFLSSRFSSIFFEAKDIPHDFIKTVPMGFTNFYVLQTPRGVIEDCVEAARLRPPSQRRLAFAAWGKVWAYLDNKLNDRRELINFLELETTKQWVIRQLLDFEDYWRELGLYKYSLCPRGQGIQAPKIFEALILRVVPVVTHVAAFEDLAQLGLPLLIIDSWSSLTPAYLERVYEEKFQHVDWEHVLSMISIEGIESLVMQSNTSARIEISSSGTFQ